MMQSPKFFLIPLLLLGWATVGQAAFTVSLCARVNDEPVSNALVECFDSDWGNDDHVGRPTYTDSTGCVAIRDSQWWWEDPDIYCRIQANGQCFRSTATPIRYNHNKRRNLDYGTLYLNPDNDYCGDFGAAANGCGPEAFPDWLNDVFTDVSGFDTQCAAHDNCYADCTRPRSLCDDDDFWADMLAVCATSDTCQVLAFLFHQAVNVAGQAACKAARTHCASTHPCEQ